MSEAATGSVDEGDLGLERAYLAGARAELARMRERTLALSVLGGDSASEEQLRVALDRRLAALGDDPETTLFFGRIDHALPRERFYIGRRHVHDDDGEPVVIDWRADVAAAFYRATHAEPMNVAMRRRFGIDKGQITAYEDEHLLDAREADLHSRILTAEIERPRVGPMRDIVATIQPEQDVIVRADFSDTVCVQGGPGTGKSAVGLHRAAFLLYAHRERLRRSGVLVVGPNAGFLAYIAHVLPALGEVNVTQVTLEQLLSHVRVKAEDPGVVATLKGDARMAEVLRRAVESHLNKPIDALVVPRGTRRWRVGPRRQAEIVEELRTRGVRYGAARAMLAQRLAHEVMTGMEAAGESPAEKTQDTIARSKPLRVAVDRLWPRVDPVRLVLSVLSDPTRLAKWADGILSEDEQRRLLWATPPKGPGSARWSLADAVLVDEVADLVERLPSLGHVVLDEAQDLSPMQLRAVGRRCSTGAATVLGDIAQGTTPWATADWATTLRHLGKSDARVEVLARSYRVPSSVIDFASRLLPAIAVGVPAPTAVPEHVGSLELVRVAALEPGIDTAVRTLLTQDGSLAVIVSDGRVTALSRRLGRAGIAHAVLGDGGASQQLTVVPATLVKGLEYDHVVVVEPAEIVEAEAHHWQGLRRLYVALTRAVSGLTVVHARALPDDLTSSSSAA